MIDNLEGEAGESSGASVVHLTSAALHAGVDDIRRAPRDDGRLELVVRRPAVDEREVLEEGELELTCGLVGDNWKVKGSSTTADGSAHPAKQITFMSSRTAALVAGKADHGGLAGDQLYLDLDISNANLPAGTRLSIGTAVIEVSVEPHNGCQKFSARFGLDALRFVNSPLGKELRLRGANAMVVVPGVIRVGDRVTVDRATVAAATVDRATASG